MPLAVRVEVTGSSRAHQRLAADPLAWANQIRAAALDQAGGRVWIEKVKVRTEAIRSPDQEVLSDGPVGELLRYLSELRSDETQLVELAGELDDLRRKLPDALLRGDESLEFRDPKCLRQWLDEVQPLVTSRLMAGARS
jgi:hypothetical protein